MDSSDFLRSSLAVRAIYCKSKSDLSDLDIKDFGYLALVGSNPKDFGMKNTFYMYAVTGDSHFLLGRYRLVIDGQTDVAKHLGMMLEGRSYLQFPLISLHYLGLGESEDIYKRLPLIFETSKIEKALIDLKDLSVLEHRKMVIPGSLVISKSYQSSLLRDTSAKNARKFGAQLLGLEDRISTHRSAFAITVFLSVDTQPYTIEFDFAEKTLPSNITVLIGKNGTGKTQCLEHLANLLIGSANAAKRFKVPYATLTGNADFSQIIAVSLSPFEKFLRAGTEKSDRSGPANLTFAEQSSLIKTYIYAGLRDDKARIRLSVADDRSVQAFCDVAENRSSSFTSLYADRFSVLKISLAAVFDFDEIAVALKPKLRSADSKMEPIKIVGADGEFVQEGVDKVQAARDSNRELLFFANGERVFLSAGQKQYVYLATILFGYMLEGSLLLLDEPELYLHPELEISLMSMLKQVLYVFKSHAIIATHSSIIVREVPTASVRVLYRDGADVLVRRPRLETFGADISTILAEVFNADDRAGYQDWLNSFGNGFETFTDFLQTATELKLDESAISYVRNAVFLKSDI